MRLYEGFLKSGIGPSAALRRAVIGLLVMILPAAGCVRAEGSDPPQDGRRLDELLPAMSPAGAQAQRSVSEPRRIPDVATVPPSDAARAAGRSETTLPTAGTAAAGSDADTRRPAGTAPQAGAALNPAGAGSTDPGDTPIPLGSSFDGEEPPPDVAAAILSAYAAFWDNYWDAASHPVDPEHPGIARYSTEPLRSRAAGVLLGRATEGIALRLPPDHGAGRIVHIEGWDRDGAELLDCFVDTAVLYEVSTGRVRNDEQATVVHLALMRRVGGSWRVAEIFEQANHTGRTDGCIMHVNTRETLVQTGTAPAPSPGGHAGRAARVQESFW